MMILSIFFVCLFVCFSLVHFMLEEVVNSAVNRCISTELMEPSVSTTKPDSMTTNHIPPKSVIASGNSTFQ